MVLVLMVYAQDEIHSELFFGHLLFEWSLLGSCCCDVEISEWLLCIWVSPQHIIIQMYRMKCILSYFRAFVFSNCFHLEAVAVMLRLLCSQFKFDLIIIHISMVCL